MNEIVAFVIKVNVVTFPLGEIEVGNMKWCWNVGILFSSHLTPLPPWPKQPLFNYRSSRIHSFLDRRYPIRKCWKGKMVLIPKAIFLKKSYFCKILKFNGAGKTEIITHFKKFLRYKVLTTFFYIYDMMDDNSGCHRLIDGGNRRAHFSIYRKNWIVWKSYYFSVILTLHTFHSHCRSIRRMPARPVESADKSWMKTRPTFVTFLSCLCRTMSHTFAALGRRWHSEK